MGRVVQQGHGAAGVVLEDAQVLEAAELFGVGEGGGDAIVQAHGPFGFDGQEERFAHEGVLEGGGAWSTLNQHVSKSIGRSVSHGGGAVLVMMGGRERDN